MAEKESGRGGLLGVVIRFGKWLLGVFSRPEKKPEPPEGPAPPDNGTPPGPEDAGPSSLPGGLPPDDAGPPDGEPTPQ